MSVPQIGDTNVRGYVIDAVWKTSSGMHVGQSFECLESLYGNRSADGFNPLIFSSVVPTGLPYGTEVVFDVVAGPQGQAVASNVRRA
jgi:hypothetical protein